MREHQGRSRFKYWVENGIGLGRIAGIEVRLHLALGLMLLFWFLFALVSPEPLARLLQVLVLGSVLIGSVLLHELGHCYAARRVGGDAERIMLWPLGGLAEIRGSEQSAIHEFLIVLFGPLVSLGLALAATAVGFLWPESYRAGVVSGFVYSVVRTIAYVNWALFIFNMAVPLFPMDAARIIRSLLSMRYSPGRVTYSMCLAGFFVAGAMACLFFVGPFADGEGYTNIFFLFIAAFGVQTCIIELRRLEYATVYVDPLPQGPPYRRLLRESLIVFRIRPATTARIVPIQGSDAGTSDAEPLSERESLELQLEQAVKKEDFARAAEIRDRLKNLALETQPR